MSALRFARWQQATHRANGAQPGARALMAGLVARYPQARSWGIFAVRDTVLGNLSAHAEGRALDLGCSRSEGARVVRDLLSLRTTNPEGRELRGPACLGISVLIHDRTIYSARSPHGRPYAGDPHTDHVHIELTRKAALHLRLSRVRRVLGLA